jgi:hypothetical protein
MVVLVALQDYGINIAKVGVKKLASIVLLILTFSPSVRSTRLHTLFLSRAFCNGASWTEREFDRCTVYDVTSRPHIA